MKSRPLSSGAWVAICAGLVIAMAYLRLVVFADQIISLTYALPLLVCYWNRDRRLLWGMAAAFASIATFKVFWVLRASDVPLDTRAVNLGFQLLNIGIVASVLHVVIRATSELERTAAELAESNDELSVREEEIRAQNEELQAQSEELEQQMEELSTQSNELRALNTQLEARERTLSDLLDTSFGVPTERETLSHLGAAVARLLGSRADGAALVFPSRREVQPLFGVAASARCPAAERTLASVVCARDRAGFLADVALRPDIDAPPLVDGREVRALLAAPLRDAADRSAALEVYSTVAGAWSEHELRIAQWLADQCGRLASHAQLRGEVERERQLLLAVTETMSAALFLTNAAGECTYMNGAAETLLGRSFASVRGVALHAIVHPAAEHDAASCSLLAPTAPERRDDVFVRASGERVPVVCVAAPARLGTDLHATVVEARDVTEQRRIERERERLLDSERAARVESERAAQSKDEFVATLSHELRTPLNAVLGWATLLRDDPNDAERARGLEVIERNARHQAQLISDLLDISSINAGKVNLEFGRVDVVALVDAALENVRPSADAKGVTLERIANAGPASVVGDPVRVQQIVWNLLTNAIKFTPSGGRVTTSITRDAAQVLVRVTDTGIGLDGDTLPHVFERYWQGQGTSGRRNAGLGLGLAIAKKLVELHGGRIEARSDGSGRGATFTVQLPSAQDERAERGPATGPGLLASSSFASSRLPDVRVLVVEDDADAMALLVRVLTHCGAEVTTAASGREGLIAVQRARPDVLVSDIGMPEMDGYALIHHVRVELGLGAHELPAIALTAFARPEDRTRSHLAGFQAHLGKPVDIAELIATVARLVRAPRDS